jgi:hypothetical protein
MTSNFRPPTEELLLIAETLGEVKSKTDKLEAEFQTQTRPLEAATNAVSAAISGIKALQFHVLDNNLGALSARVEEMRQAEQELRDLFSLTGRIDLYHKLCEEREKILGNRAAIAKQAGLAKAAKQRKLDAQLQTAQVITAFALAIVIAGTIAWGTIWVLTNPASPFVADQPTTQRNKR